MSIQEVDRILCDFLDRFNNQLDSAIFREVISDEDIRTVLRNWPDLLDVRTEWEE